jgi:DNA-binding transcriptional MerR regulator/ubiquinone/menaquinone biosynthesis C-methylase UbiE
MDSKRGRRWQIGDLAKQTGLSVRALRHYDELGLLRPSERSDAGYRLYAEADVRRLYRIVALRQLDFPLEEIASLLEEGEPDLAETARRHLERVERDLESQKRLRERLAPMVEALDRSEEPSVDEFIDATEVTSVNPQEDQWEELFHPDTVYFEEPILTGERSDRDVELLMGLLELKEGTEVLDAPCGWGRHSNRLAARGCRVVGLDNDSLVLDRAREEATAMGVLPDYVEGDLRQLPFEDGRFEGLFNWRTSFGFFDEQGNRKQLQEFARVLRPGGRLAMDLHSRDDVVRRMPARGPLISVGERDDDFLIERSHFDPVAGRSRTERIVVRDGRVRRFRFSLATPPASVLREWLHDAGFTQVEAYGPHGEPLRFDSRRLVVVAER